MCDRQNGESEKKYTNLALPSKNRQSTATRQPSKQTEANFSKSDFVNFLPLKFLFFFFCFGISSVPKKCTREKWQSSKTAKRRLNELVFLSQFRFYVVYFPSLCAPSCFANDFFLFRYFYDGIEKKKKAIVRMSVLGRCARVSKTFSEIISSQLNKYTFLK